MIRFEASVDAMATTYSVVLYGDSHQTMQEAADAAFAEVERLDRLLSVYRPDSAWSEINRLAGQRPVAVSPEVFDLISRCVQYSRSSQGTFDITIGPLIKAWGFFKAAGRLPSSDEIVTALARTGYRHIILDQSAGTVQFDIDGIEINPGGIGKGYAVDRIVEILRHRGLATALVMASSSSIYGMGTPPDEPRGWRIDIPDPIRPTLHSATQVFLRDMSLSTSAGYVRTFRAGGRAQSHIIDPRTGYPAQGMLMVCVTAARTIDSEAWTKPFFIHGREWAAKNRPPLCSAFFCPDGPDADWDWLA